MAAFRTPPEVALAHLDLPGARAVCAVVRSDVAVVIVIVPAYEPPVGLFCKLTRAGDGWDFSGLAGLGSPLTVMSPAAGGGDLCFGIGTSAEVSEVHVMVGQEPCAIPVQGGYGALILTGQPPEPSWEVKSYQTVDGRDIAGSPPLPRVFTKQADPHFLAAIDDARHFVWAAQMQIERFVNTFSSDVRVSFVPPSLEDQRRSSLAFAEAEFLLIAAAQAEKALGLLDGPHLSANLSSDIRVLRNLHEHWEQHRASFAHPSLPKTRAGKTFADKYPTERPWAFQSGSDGHYVSVLRLESLWDELVAIDRELGRMRNAALAGTAVPHVVEDESRPLRPMPQPAATRTLAKSVLRQPLLIGDP
jgi:hypothetical protein